MLFCGCSYSQDPESSFEGGRGVSRVRDGGTWGTWLHVERKGRRGRNDGETAGKMSTLGRTVCLSRSAMLCPPTVAFSAFGAHGCFWFFARIVRGEQELFQVILKPSEENQ